MKIKNGSQGHKRVTEDNKKEIIVSFLVANLSIVLIAIVVTVIFLIPFIYIWGPIEIEITFKDGWLRIVEMIFIIPVGGIVGGIVSHEFIHGISWHYFGKKPWSSIKFGINWKILTIYTHCTEPLSIRSYMLGSAMPGLVMGIIPAIVAIFTGIDWLLVLGIIFTMLAAGDFLVLFLLRNIPGNYLAEDHPTKAGCYVYEIPQSDKDVDSRIHI